MKAKKESKKTLCHYCKLMVRMITDGKRRACPNCGRKINR